MWKFGLCLAMLIFFTSSLIAAAETLTIDGQGPGLTFDGLGGLSVAPARGSCSIIPSRSEANCSIYSSSRIAAQRCIT